MPLESRTAADGLAGTLERTEVQRGALSVPGREVVHADALVALRPQGQRALELVREVGR